MLIFFYPWSCSVPRYVAHVDDTLACTVRLCVGILPRTLWLQLRSAEHLLLPLTLTAAGVKIRPALSVMQKQFLSNKNDIRCEGNAH